MKKHHLLFFFLTTTVALLGFGCKGLSQADQAAIRPVTLTYWTVYDDVAALQALAAAYQQLRPYVTMNIKQIRYDEFDTLLVNALADDAGPDIASIHTRWLGKYQNRLASMPPSVQVADIQVTGQYSKQTVVTIIKNPLPSISNIKNQYVTAVADDVIRDGSIYGLPLAVDTMGLYYNKTLLDKAGVPLPPTTWDEFVAAVKKATKFDKQGNIAQSGVALGTGNNIDYTFDILSLLMTQNKLVMSRGNVVTFASGLENFNAVSHPALEALRFYTDFAQPTKDVYAWNAKQNNAFESFVRGKSVFYFGFAYDRSRITSQAPQLDIQAIPIPQLNSAAPVNVANYWVETVLKKSKHQNEAWDFIRFMSLPENIKKYSNASGQPSPLRIHVKDELASETMSPFAANVLTATSWYHGRNFEAVDAAFRELATSYLLPYGDREDPNRRDANLILRTAQIVQQTF